MNRHLLREWRSRVRSEDTIICLGDVAHPDAWDDRRLVLDIQNCPGERVLILGNHDLDREALREVGFRTQVLAGAVRHRGGFRPIREQGEKVLVECSDLAGGGARAYEVGGRPMGVLGGGQTTSRDETLDETPIIIGNRGSLNLCSTRTPSHAR